MLRLFACFTLLTALTACTKADSADLKTSGFYASINGAADGNGSTTISVQLRLGELSSTYVELGMGDTLTARTGSDSPHTMSKSDFLNIVTYGTTLTGDEEGRTFTVALNRAPSDVSAPNSVVTLPAQLTLSSPIEGTTFARGKDAITVSWSNSGKTEPLTIDLTGTCIDTITKSNVADTGSLVINAGDVKAAKDKDSETCPVAVRIQRTKTGTLDSNYGKGGVVHGTQVRTVNVKSGP